MNSPLEQNFYELLEVPRDATLAEIDRAYDRARAYYGPGSVAVYALATPDELKRVQDRIDEAYLVLGDEAARVEYDARIGPPGPDERPLRSEVRRPPSEPAAEPPKLALVPEPPPVVPAAEPPAAAAEVKPEPKAKPAAVIASEPQAKSEPAVEPAAPPAEAKVEPPPTEPVAKAPESEAKPSEAEAKPEVRPAASEGPIPPPHMASPEPAPKAAPVRRERPAEPGSARLPRPELAPDAVVSGELLRELREAQGLSLQEIADRTKIGRPHLENIEADRFGSLPAHVYLRGFLMALARELRLDPLRVAKSYLEQMGERPGAKSRS